MLLAYQSDSVWHQPCSVEYGLVSATPKIAVLVSTQALAVGGTIKILLVWLFLRVLTQAKLGCLTHWGQQHHIER